MDVKDALQSDYDRKSDIIASRLADFSTFHSSHKSWFLEDGRMVLKPVASSQDDIIFEELSFCLLTANTSAAMGMRGIDAIRPVLKSGPQEDIQSRLISCGYRYPNMRAGYIFQAREKLKAMTGMRLKSHFDSFADPRDAREFLVENIKGLGYKEASHFLRNIGYKGLAILDKHILRTLHEWERIPDVPKSLNRKRYLDIEQKLIDFSRDAGIGIDEMDLLLWSRKTGTIMK